jgi:hypothetical protein
MESTPLSRTVFMESTNPYANLGLKDYAAFAPSDEQTAFTRRVFGSLTAAILVQVATLLIIFWLVPIHNILHFVNQTGTYGWLVGVGLYIAYLYFSSTSLRRSSRNMAIWGYVVHILMTSLVFSPLFALSTTIDRSIPITTGIAAVAVIGGLTAYAQVGSLESLKHRGIVVVTLLAVLTALTIFFVTDNGMQASEWLALGSILLTAVFIVLDIGNMMCRYRTNEWLRSSMNQYTTLALILCIFMSTAIVIFR